MKDVARPQQHLANIFAAVGSGDATADVRALLEIGLREMLEREHAERVAEGKATREYPYVSEAGKCPRQLYFALTNTPKTEALTLDSWMTLRLGKLAESAYVELLEAAGVKILQQERVVFEVEGEEIHGKLDLLLEIPENLREAIPGLGATELWELKVKNSRALGWMLKRGGPEADDNYVRQARLYAHGGELGLYPRAERVRLVYAASGATKGEPLFHSWYIEPNEKAAADDLRILADAMKVARAGADPGIPVAYLKCPLWPCGYCDYKRLCHPK